MKKIIGVVIDGKYDWQKRLVGQEVIIENINIRTKDGTGGMIDYHSCKRVRDEDDNNFNINNMMLTEKFLASLKREPEKSFRKTGITDGDDIPTDEGMKLICTILLQENEAVRKAITKIAKDILDDEKDD